MLDILKQLEKLEQEYKIRYKYFGSFDIVLSTDGSGTVKANFYRFGHYTENVCSFSDLDDLKKQVIRLRSIVV